MIPRPETELLCDYVIEYCHQSPPPSKGWTIADIGTGSGCIAITLAQTIKNLQRVYAVDITPAALKVAQKNVLLHHASNKIVLLAGSLLDQLNQPIDIIVANLPYIPDDRIPSLAREVADNEPYLALSGGKDGFQIYRQLLKQIALLGKKPQLLIIEIDVTQTQIVQTFLETYLPQCTGIILNDYSALPRLAVVKNL